MVVNYSPSEILAIARFLQSHDILDDHRKELEPKLRGVRDGRLKALNNVPVCYRSFVAQQLTDVRSLLAELQVREKGQTDELTALESEREIFLQSMPKDDHPRKHWLKSQILNRRSA